MIITYPDRNFPGAVEVANRKVNLVGRTARERRFDGVADADVLTITRR
jgi:hypothetical protein